MTNIYNPTGHETVIKNIIKSNGLYVYDENNKAYIDLESGVWCTSVGHNNKRVNTVIKNQIDTIMHNGFCYSNNIMQEAAKSVLEITKMNNGKCIFLCSGSEAIEVSRQIAQKITNRKKTMTLNDSYLGAYSSATNREHDWYIFNWEKCPSCRNNQNCDASCPLIKNIPEDLSEFIFEPGSSSGFVRFPPIGLIDMIAETVKNNNGKIIINEVTVGVGRTGKWFGYNHYNIEPDMVAIGKGIGNGYPVSVAAISEKTAKEAEAAHFHYGQSHMNDPLGAAVVKEVISIIIEENLIQTAERNGPNFLSLLQGLVDNKHLTAVRGRGLMFAVDIINKETGDLIFKELINQGYIVCNRGGLFRIDPPLIIQKNIFEIFVNTFKKILVSKKIM